MGSLSEKMNPQTLILFLLHSVASSVEIPPVNAQRYPLPRIVVLGTAGVGKSVFANALFNRSSEYKPPGPKKCFEGGLVEKGQSGGKTQEACIETGYFLGDERNGEITVVDTPGLGMNSLEELEYVHTFAMLYNSVGDNRPTRERLAVFDHYNRIFGKHFLKNVIIVATHWGYDQASVHQREKNLKGIPWLQYQKQISGFDELEYADQLKAIYFEPWDLVFDENLRYKSYDALREIYQLSRQNEPFHCQDIEVVLDAISQKEEEIKNLTRQVMHLNECQKSQRKVPKLEEELETCTSAKAARVGKSKTEMIGLGIGCTVLGIIIAVVAVRFYKLNAKNAKYNDDDYDDRERLAGNNETISLENNLTEKTEKFDDNNEKISFENSQTEETEKFGGDKEKISLETTPTEEFKKSGGSDETIRLENNSTEENKTEP